MLIRIGIMVLFMAMMTADSESLVVPVVLLLIGAGLIHLGNRKEADNEDSI